MVHFTQCGAPGLSSSAPGRMPPGMRVAPFGDPGIKGCVLLPPDYRGLPRPSSPSGSSRHPPWTYIRLAISLLPPPARALRPERGRKGTRPLSPLPSLSSSCQRPFLIRHRASQSRRMNYVGRDRVELSTPALSERCSNQLSYHPIKPAQKGKTPQSRAPRAAHRRAFFSLSLKRR